MIDLKKFYKKGYIVIENILSDGEIKLLKEKFFFSKTSKIFLPTFPVAPTIQIFMVIM